MVLEFGRYASPSWKIGAWLEAEAAVSPLLKAIRATKHRTVLLK
jgi:hypothetical protein